MPRYMPDIEMREVTETYRPWWGLGMVRRTRVWSETEGPFGYDGATVGAFARRGDGQ